MRAQNDPCESLDTRAVYGMAKGNTQRKKVKWKCSRSVVLLSTCVRLTGPSWCPNGLQDLAFLSRRVGFIRSCGDPSTHRDESDEIFSQHFSITNYVLPTYVSTKDLGFLAKANPRFVYIYDQLRYLP